MSDNTTCLPLTGPNDHPIIVCVDFNEEMQRWDVSLVVGNCRSEEQAQQLADRLQDFAEEELGGEMHRFQ